MGKIISQPQRLTKTTIAFALLFSSVTAYGHAGPAHSHPSIAGPLVALCAFSIMLGFYRLHKAKVHPLANRKG